MYHMFQYSICFDSETLLSTLAGVELFGTCWTDFHITDRPQGLNALTADVSCQKFPWVRRRCESISWKSEMWKLLSEAAAGTIIWDGSHKDSLQPVQVREPGGSRDAHSKNSTTHERHWTSLDTTQEVPAQNSGQNLGILSTWSKIKSNSTF